MDNESESTPEIESPENQEDSGAGKLTIKLKIPKRRESSPIEANYDDQLRVCEVCNKGFSNGKALGGHMRVHVQERGDLTKNSKNPKKNYRNSNDKSQHLVSLSEKPTCLLCDKDFPSLQALFGHMRCHPEREYRGICPPQTGLNLLSSSSDEREASKPPLPTWSTTAKRGRQSLISAAMSSSSSNHDLSEEDKEAAYDLMSLARREYFVPDLTSKPKTEAKIDSALNVGAEIVYKDQSFEPKKQRIGDLGYGSKHKQLKTNETVVFEGKAKGKSLIGTNENSLSDNAFVANDSDGSVSSDELVKNMVPNQKRIIKKKPKFKDLKSVEEESDDNGNNKNKVDQKGLLVKYKCSTCSKCFPSHQALGGHRSSHNKAKYSSQTLASTVDNDFVSDSVQAGGDGAIIDDVQIQSVHPTHQCKICNKVFPTGQALGGHQRCHWAGPAEVGQASSHATSSPREEASRTGAPMLDLNEPPPMEEDGGADQSQIADELQLYGYVSSSHNSTA